MDPDPLGSKRKLAFQSRPRSQNIVIFGTVTGIHLFCPIHIFFFIYLAGKSGTPVQIVLFHINHVLRNMKLIHLYFTTLGCEHC